MTHDFYGTKRITAWPAEKDGQPGYSVKYADGYISWSPKATFEAAYQPLDALSFGHALVALEEGHLVARKGWNGKGMWLTLIHGSSGLLKRNGSAYEMQSCIGMKTATGVMQPGWLASQNDMLAKDWTIVDL